MLHLAVEDAFEHLLATWRTHESRQQQMRAELDKAAPCGLLAQPTDSPGPQTASAQAAAAEQGGLLAQPTDSPGPQTASAQAAAAEQGGLLALAQSRQDLDQARERMHKLRCTIYPEADELEAVVESVWCETLEIVVHLRWADRHASRPGNFTCSCGHLVPVNYARTGNGA